MPEIGNNLKCVQLFKILNWISLEHVKVMKRRRKIKQSNWSDKKLYIKSNRTEIIVPNFVWE